MNTITKWLTDPDAANSLSPRSGIKTSSNKSAIGSYHQAKKIPGTVKNTKNADPTSPGPCWLAGYIKDDPFRITDYLETNNGQIAKIPQIEYEEISAD